MSPPNIRKLEGAIVDIISCARDDGQLSKLTVRIVRQQLAARFDLEEDALNSGEYKSFVKDTVHATVDRLQNASDEGAESSRPKAPKKDKPDGMAKTAPRKHKQEARARPSNEASPETANVSEGDAPPPKKGSARSKPPKPSKTSKKPESEIKYKSKAIIETSDEEAASESGTRKPIRSPKKGRVSAGSSSPKQKQQQQRANKNDSDVEMDTGEGPGPSSLSFEPKHAVEPRKPSSSNTKELTGQLMDSELSSVIDEPPKKRQKQENESVKPRKDEKTKRRKKETLPKDEETINRLKAIVVACGVRKVWKKEFEGLDKPSQQIKRLHSILGDLGMTPRYSLEKAKAIRERRELAQELKDVQEFEKGIKRVGKGPRSSSETHESSDQDGDNTDAPARKKQSARASIMAFLQDQSEEE